MIPLKDRVTIEKPGGEDEWGYPTPGTTVALRCRITEGTDITRNQNGEEVVTNTRVLLKGAQAVGYNDKFTWTDAAGVTRSAYPIRISFIKGPTSRVLFTKVEL
jgi:hypothetical protein